MNDLITKKRSDYLQKHLTKNNIKQYLKEGIVE